MRIPKRALLLKFNLLLLFYAGSLFGYDLSQVRMEKLQNGLTVMMLEDHTQPLVSTQVLYKVGGRNETDGKTGLAHFCEHMSFRATKNFPDTGVTSSIYAVGGEWHGYTWIDQTTYYETVPAADLELTLRIQADRMGSALIKEDEVEAERGAVLTELHSYQNDPVISLNDEVMKTVFLEHPYRTNTIGWENDVQKLTHTDIVDFYKLYYNPSNAILAIAGDMDPGKTMALVHRLFDPIAAGNTDSLPRAVETPQEGVRRVEMRGPGSSSDFEIAYMAPAANHPDYPAFLVLQAILGGSPGVNFHQKEEGEPAHKGTRLYGVAEGISTFFIPTAQPYVFVIAGRTDVHPDSAAMEQTVEAKITEMRDKPASAEELNQAKKQVQAELVFDIETTEDAAHQMAYFEGIGAFDVLQHLPDLISGVTAEDVHRVASAYLQPYQRTIGCYMGGQTIPSANPIATSTPTAASLTRPLVHGSVPSPETSVPQISKLKNGNVVITKKFSRSPDGYLRILIPTNTVELSADYSRNEPVWGYSSINCRFLKDDAQTAIDQCFAPLKNAWKVADPPTPSEDPEARLSETVLEMIRFGKGKASPLIASASGDFDEAKVNTQLSALLSDPRIPALPPQTYSTLEIAQKNKTVSLPGKPQSAFAYFLSAPNPADSSSLPYRLLLYIMSHGYEGRLGIELIHKLGLIYYIDSRYNSNGKVSLVTMTAGVDPGKLKSTQEAFFRVLNELKTNPPTETELTEAKESLIGRRQTAYQSDAEVSGFYGREWIEQGRLLSDAEFKKRVRSVTLEQVRNIVPNFIQGSTAVVDTNPVVQ